MAQAAESVMFTEIGRTLEEPCSLKKTEERLSRNLQRPELEDTIEHNVLRMAKNHIGKDTLLLVDPSDLSKAYAKKMEYLATVRDGSTGELTQGYHTMHIVGGELDSKQIVPLYQRLWSCDAPDFESENVEILRGVDAVMEHVGNNGIFVYDRSGDRINLFAPFLERKARFLVRLVGKLPWHQIGYAIVLLVSGALKLNLMPNHEKGVGSSPRVSDLLLEHKLPSGRKRNRIMRNESEVTSPLVPLRTAYGIGVVGTVIAIGCPALWPLIIPSAFAIHRSVKAGVANEIESAVSEAESDELAETWRDNRTDGETSIEVARSTHLETNAFSFPATKTTRYTLDSNE